MTKSSSISLINSIELSAVFVSKLKIIDSIYLSLFSLFILFSIYFLIFGIKVRSYHNITYDYRGEMV